MASSSWTLQVGDRVFSGVDPAEHVRTHPSMYLGVVSPTSRTPSIGFLDGQGLAPRPKGLVYSHGAVVACMEAVSNALDYLDGRKNASIAVRIDAATGAIAVSSTGQGIPIEKRADGTWLPEVLLGTLHTSENYTESTRGYRVGVNGIGGKVINLCSVWYRVNLNDGQYTQRWEDHMRICHPPSVSAPPSGKKAKKPRFLLEFLLDWSIFGGWTSDTYEALCAAALLAGYSRPPGVTYKVNDVVLDGDRRGAAHLLRDLYGAETRVASATRIAKNENEKARREMKNRPALEVAVARVGSGSAALAKYGFINGTRTDEGQHMDTFCELLKAGVEAAVHKALTPEQRKALPPGKIGHMLKGCTVVLLACFHAPTWASPDKTHYAGAVPAMQLRSEFIEQVVAELDIMSRVTSLLQRQDAAPVMPKTSAKSAAEAAARFHGDDIMITKYRPAAIKRDPRSTLIVAEGDSAVKFVTAGLPSLPNKKYYGVLPLLGKLPSGPKLLAGLKKTKGKLANKYTETINTLLAVLGVTPGSKPQWADLHYKKVWILADQDHDGHHITGLVVSVLVCLLPDVVREHPTDFMYRFATPIKRVRSSRRGNDDEYYDFFTERAYQEWLATVPPEARGARFWDEEYKKGLAAWQGADAHTFFSDTGAYVCPIIYTGDETDEIIEHVFAKGHEDWRKRWIAQTDDQVPMLPYGGMPILAPDLYNGPVREYSLYVVQERAFPGADGLKRVIRRVLWVMLMNHIYEQSMAHDYRDATGLHLHDASGIKRTDQLVGITIDAVGYPHGGDSMMEAIAAKPCNYPGAGNAPLLEPHGMFPTFLDRKVSQPRYTHAGLSAAAVAIFGTGTELAMLPRHMEVKPLEAMLFVPKVPYMDGHYGVATGFNTQSLPRSMCDSISLLRFVLGRMLEGDTMDDDSVWATFFGTIAVDFGPDFRGTAALLGFDAETGVERWALEAATEYDEATGTLTIHQILPGMWTGRSIFDTASLEKAILHHRADGSASKKFILSARTTDVDGWPGAVLKLDTDMVGGLPGGIDYVYRALELRLVYSDHLCNVLDWSGKIVSRSSPVEAVRSLIPPRLALYLLRLENERREAAFEIVRKRVRRQVLELFAAGKAAPVFGGMVQLLEEHGVPKLAGSPPPMLVLHDYVEHVAALLAAYDPAAYSAGRYLAEEEERNRTAADASYDYVLSTNLRHWETTSSVRRLEADERRLTDMLQLMCEQTPAQLWLNDLNVVEAALNLTRERFDKILKGKRTAKGKRRAPK